MVSRLNNDDCERLIDLGHFDRAAALGLGLMCGTVGLGAAYVFVVNVYAAVKVD